MGKLGESVEELLLPSRIKPYVNFKASTILVLALVFITAAFRAFVKLPPEQIAMYAAQDKLLHNPSFLVGYNVLVGVCFVLIYATRNRPGVYHWRVAFYTMLLTGLLVELVALLLPLRSA